MGGSVGHGCVVEICTVASLAGCLRKSRRCSFVDHMARRRIQRVDVIFLMWELPDPKHVGAVPRIYKCLSALEHLVASFSFKINSEIDHTYGNETELVFKERVARRCSCLCNRSFSSFPSQPNWLRVFQHYRPLTVASLVASTRSVFFRVLHRRPRHKGTTQMVWVETCITRINAVTSRVPFGYINGSCP